MDRSPDSRTDSSTESVTIKNLQDEIDHLVLIIDYLMIQNQQFPNLDNPEMSQIQEIIKWFEVTRDILKRLEFSVFSLDIPVTSQSSTKQIAKTEEQFKNIRDTIDLGLEALISLGQIARSSVVDDCPPEHPERGGWFAKKPTRLGKAKKMLRKAWGKMKRILRNQNR